MVGMEEGEHEGEGGWVSGGEVDIRESGHGGEVSIRGEAGQE